MPFGDTASAPPGHPGSIEFGERRGEPTYYGNHSTASAPPGYYDVKVGEGRSTASAPPPSQNNFEGEGCTASAPPFGALQMENSLQMQNYALSDAKGPPNYFPSDSKAPPGYFPSNPKAPKAPEAKTPVALPKKAPTHAEDDNISFDEKMDVTEGPREGAGLIAACGRSPHLKSWTLTLGTICILILLIFAEIEVLDMNKTILIVCVSVFGLSYLVEIFCSSSFSYLNQAHEKGTVKIIVRNMKKAKPSIHWFVQCYHYETRRYTTTDSDGNRKTKTKRVRVNTWSAAKYFQFHSWVDKSDPVVGLDKFRLTKLRLTKSYMFDTTASQMEFDRQKASFKASNKRDTHQDFTETFNVPGFKSRILCEAMEGYRPYCLKLRFFLLFHLLFLGPCYRWWFSSICGIKDLDIVKVISCA